MSGDINKEIQQFYKAQNVSEVTIKKESFYSHMNETSVDPNLSKLGSFEKQKDAVLGWLDSDEDSDDERSNQKLDTSKTKSNQKTDDVCSTTFSRKTAKGMMNILC